MVLEIEEEEVPVSCPRTCAVQAGLLFHLSGSRVRRKEGQPTVQNARRVWNLNLTFTGIEVLPDSFPLLESLEHLIIVGCYRLQGRLPLWEMKSLQKLAAGDEAGEKDVGEILDGITRYSQQAKEYRRIKHSNIQDEQHWAKLELSIWVEGSQEREIELRVYRPCEGRKGQSIRLRHHFP